MNDKHKLKAGLLAIVAATLAGCNQSGGGGDSTATTTNSPTIGDYAHAAATNTANAASAAWTNLKDSFHSAMGDSYDQKDQFVASTKADAAAVDRKMGELSDKVAAAGDNAKAGLQDKMQDLKAKRAVLDQKMSAVEAASADDWNAAKTNFQNSYYDVKAALKDTWQSIKGNGS